MRDLRRDGQDRVRWVRIRDGLSIRPEGSRDSCRGPGAGRPELIGRYPDEFPPSGGDELHNYCAKHLPGNAFRGADVFVNGKRFDALQPLTRTLWEIKTDNFDNYKPIVKKFALDKEVPELKRELKLARACGYEFRIGVRSAAHKKALEDAAPELKPLIVIMDWC